MLLQAHWVISYHTDLHVLNKRPNILVRLYFGREATLAHPILPFFLISQFSIVSVKDLEVSQKIQKHFAASSRNYVYSKTGVL